MVIKYSVWEEHEVKKSFYLELIVNLDIKMIKTEFGITLYLMIPTHTAQ
jgi:hypothetical protein